jgi:hypothetical protein
LVLTWNEGWSQLDDAPAYIWISLCYIGLMQYPAASAKTAESTNAAPSVKAALSTISAPSASSHPSANAA